MGRLGWENTKNMLKPGEKVKYKGGVVNFGEQRTLTPIETYIWKHLNYGDRNLYIIQHNEGEIADFFIHNTVSFGPTASFADLKKMVEKSGNPTLKFAYVWEEELISLTIKQPIIEEKKEEEPLMQIDDYLEETESTEKEKTPAPENKKPINLFTSGNVIVSNMNLATPKPQKIYFLKMQEEFQVQKPNGITEIGNAGDYLLCSFGKKLSIASEEEFNEKYQINKNLVTKIIGKEGEEFLLNPKVANYIDFIEKQEMKLREELYLKRKQEQLIEEEDEKEV